MSNFKINVNKNNRKILAQLQDSSKLTRRGIRTAYYRIGNLLVKEARDSIVNGPKSGRLYRIAGRRHRASAPGQAPANLSGLLKRSIAYQQRGGFQMRFGARTEYAPFLELGTRKMDQRPFLITAINEKEKDTGVIFEKEIQKELLKGS